MVRRKILAGFSACPTPRLAFFQATPGLGERRKPLSEVTDGETERCYFSLEREQRAPREWEHGSRLLGGVVESLSLMKPALIA